MPRIYSQKQKARDQVMSHVVAEWRRKERGVSPRQVVATAPSGAAPARGLHRAAREAEWQHPLPPAPWRAPPSGGVTLALRLPISWDGPVTWHTAQRTHPGRPRPNQPAARGPALPSAAGSWVSPPPRALGTLQNPAPSAVLPHLGQGAPSPNGPGLTGTTLLPPRPAGGSGLER